MLQLVLAAPRSGSGKTTAACALLAAMQARGLAPCAFKSGPDYIDPMFHRAVLGVESHNLDLFFSKPETVWELYARHAAGHGAAVVEGAMGYYDGLGGVADTASAWHLADTLNLPALLVVRPKGASLTLAAELRGLMAFRTPHHIAGILLNDCKESLYKMLRPMLEKETGLPVVGCLPPLPEAAIESRHLGLKTAAEITDLQRKIALLADAAQRGIDWALLEKLCGRPAPAAIPQNFPATRVRIAVAQDAAFCFTYAETLEALRENGAELCFFSPLTDAALPENSGGLYLPGGYPELYAAQLAAMKDNAYMQLRSVDILDVTQRITNILCHRLRSWLALDHPVILASDLLMPTDLFSVPAGRILGLITAEGSGQSHAAIIARSLNIPGITQVGEDFLKDCDGREVILNATEGECILDPDAAARQRAITCICEMQRQNEELNAQLELPNRTRDGEEFELLANCFGPEDVGTAMESGASGVGLLRSSYMMMPGHAMDEQEQYLFCLLYTSPSPRDTR